MNEIDKKEFYRVKNTETGKFIGGYNKSVWAQKAAALSALQQKGVHTHNLVIYTATDEVSGVFAVDTWTQQKEEKKIKENENAICNLKRKLAPNKFLKLYTSYSGKPDEILLVQSIEDNFVNLLDIVSERSFQSTFNLLVERIKKMRNYQIL
jgi:hypothetical protein